jgi:TonB-linked SusC/RagA family outer membrane protein
MKKNKSQNHRQKWSRCLSFALVAVFMLMCNLFSFAQTQKVTGKVTDAITGELLVGVSVYEKGTQNATTTDVNGVYTLNAVKTGQVLVFSFIGMKTTEITTDARTTYDVVLQSEATGLNEVVVIGYGTQKKGDVTSAVSTVKSDKFLQGATKDAAQLIQGKVAGLTVSSSSGDPTQGTQIMLRGISTLMASSEPLVIVDGVPGNLNSVAPEDIASIDVLKDGSAAAIYGTRGNNGVIFVTTKRATTNTPSTLEYSGYMSTQAIARQMDFLTASEYRQKIAEGVGFEDLGSSTDWFKEVTRTPISQSHNLTFKGGNSVSSYTASLNYRKFQGIFQRSDNDQFIGRLNLTHSMFNNRLKFNFDLSSRNMSYWAGGDGYSFNPEIYRQVIIRNPTDVIKDADGVWQERDTYMYNNPVALLNEADGLNKEKELRYSGSVLYTPITDLRIKLMVSRVENSAMRGYYETKQHVSTTKYGKNGYASRSASSDFDNLLEFTTDYSKNLDKHNFTILGGYSYEYYETENFWEQNWDFPTDLYTYNNMGTGDALIRGEAEMGSGKSSSTLIGFFGRFNYNYDNKYLLMASLRREGSSKFGENYKWGNFPAVSLGWRISSEPFMNDLSFLHELKLRAGFGVTGTAPTDPYQSQTSLNYGDRFLYNGKWIQGIEPIRNPNPDLRWEKKAELNLGLDFAFLKGIVSGSVDLYQRTTRDMLYDYPVPVPPYLYGSILANAAEMENKGVEVMLAANNPFQSETFQWTTSLTYSMNKNELLSLSSDPAYQLTNDFINEGYTGEPIQTTTHRIQVGEPIGNFWGYKSVGVGDDGEWIIEGKDGVQKSIVDANDADKQYLGNGLPKSYLGFNNTFNYKNFDLTVNLRGAFGFQILNFSRMYYENAYDLSYNKLASAFDLVYGKELKSQLCYVSYYIEQGDYLKLDNVTLGYTFNVKNSKSFKNARVYASGLNLLTFTSYKGIDPEVNRSGLAPGNDERDKYPTTRTFSIGVNVTF